MSRDKIFEAVRIWAAPEALVVLSQYVWKGNLLSRVNNIRIKIGTIGRHGG